MPEQLRPAAFGRRKKLLDSAQFRHVFENRISVYGQYFNLHAARNSLACPRLGVTVSRKVSTSAVERNRIKRQVRESFRRIQQSLPDMDYVVVSKPGCKGQENNALRQELDALWYNSEQKCRHRLENSPV